ncbi:MAG: formimidoylglutamate deiminase [Pseudomonadota bacterium]
MAVVWAKTALTADGWVHGVRVEIGADGRIAALTPGCVAQAEDTRVSLLLPAPANAHSHAFQRAMAGLTERRGERPQDNFWTWRQLMYRFLDELTPEHVEAIAALVQMEMLEAGFGACVEFHYLHHQADGTPYDDLAEMSSRIAAAAGSTGLGLTLLPVLYQFGGCDQRPLSRGQVRFGNDINRYQRLLDGAAAALRSLGADAVLGVAPHSLRAVAQEDLRAVSAILPGSPIHIHVAEQIPEVAEVEEAWGARPVSWALDNLALNPLWCLIHATQMEPAETHRLAATGAVAGLCPITEASLGDGVFDGVRFVNAGGRMAVGSDSNIRISLAEEMRQLETSQRLRDHSRAALADADRSTGRRLFDALTLGGAQAAGRGSGCLRVEGWADLLALDMAHIDLEGLGGDTVLDAFIFAGSNEMVQDVWSAGRHLVKAGQHVKRDEIVARYQAAVRRLRAGL